MLTLPAAGTRVAVGLSGGVDSAMAAAFLREQGCAVTAVTMSVWDGSVSLPDEGLSGCYGPGEPRDLAAAAGIAERLGIPHRVIPLAPEYRNHVLEYVRSEYRIGRTPNPCAQCNRRIKFGLLPERARAAGIDFDFFATGHYARVRRDPGTGIPRLLRARDTGKDQSYFLSRLTREQLRPLLFPLGSMTKTEVRAAARSRGFADLANRAESQDFIEANSLDALFEDAPSPPGDIVDESGQVLGRHRGLIHYTVGQRKGLGIGGAGAPYFVIALDAARNRVMVGRRDALRRTSFRATECTWIGWEQRPEQRRPAEICLRLRTPSVPGSITPDPDRADVVDVVFETPQAPVSPGQIAAFYDGDLVLGSGVIDA